jgi:hypothetical protein
MPDSKRLAPLTEGSRPNKKGSWWMVRNSSGKKDVALTLMLVSFTFSIALALFGAIETLDLGDRSISFREYNMGFATTVLVPLIGLYFGRRWTDTNRGLYDQQKLYAKSSSDKEEPEDV